MKLPDKPSELIKVALSDLALAEKSEDYNIDMSQWHEPNGECSVCFAGSVMAFSLKKSKKHTLVPNNFNQDTAHKLSALDEFRNGNVELGLTTMLSIEDRYVADYKDNPKRWRKDMEKLAKDFEKVGL